MPNRTLALDVGGPTLRAALVETTLRSRRVVGVYATPRTHAGDLAADLRDLVARHELRWDEVVSALPGDVVTHRILTLPFRDRKRLDRTVPFEIESHLPFDLDDAVLDYQVLATGDHDTVVLAALAPKDAVREHLASLAAAGIEPRAVDLAPLAPLNLLRLAGAPHAGASAFVGLDAARTVVAVLRDGALVGLRTLSAGIAASRDSDAVIRDVRWSVLALAGDDSLASLGLWIGGDAAATPGLGAALERAFGTAPQTLAALALPPIPAPLRREQVPFATALGIALRDGGTAGALGIDFRRGEFAYHREREALGRGLAAAGVLTLLAIVLMVASFVVEARRLEARRDAIRAESRALFTQVLPGVRTIVNEKAQLATEIAALEKQRKAHGGLAPTAPRAIDLLRALSLGVPEKAPLDIEELSLDGETLRLRGSTRAYDTVEAVKRGLAARPEFQDVQAKDVRQSVDGERVDFRLSLTVASLEPQ